MNKPEGLLHKAILRHYQLMQLKISISGCSDPSVLQTKRDLIALYEKNGQITRAVTFQTELVSESRDQNDPPDFFSNRDRYHLIELYWKSGSHKNALLMAQSLLSELTEGLDRETVLQDIKSKEPSIDVKGILMTRVFLQKNQKSLPPRLNKEIGNSRQPSLPLFPIFFFINAPNYGSSLIPGIHMNRRVLPSPTSNSAIE